MSELNASAPTTQNQQEDSTNPRSHTSIFFERYVVWVVLAMLVAFIWYRMIALIVLSSFFLVILLVVTLWKKNALLRVIPAMELLQRRVFAGEHISLTLSLLNDKWLPLVWIELEQEQQLGITWGDDDKEQYRIRLLWLLWYQKATWTIKGTTRRRGVYRLGGWTLRSGDGFRFTEEERQVNLAADLYVYPKLVPVHVPSLSAFVQWGINGKNGGFLVDPQLIHSIRDYQNGDEWRTIHWQASAKTGVLQTKVFQPVMVRQLILFIDVVGFNFPERSEDFESFLSVIASAAVTYHQQGVMIGLASNALDYEGKAIPFSFPGTSPSTILDHLAKITPAVSAKTRDVQKCMPLGKLAAPLYYFCDSLREEHDRWFKKNKRTFPFACFYFMKDSRIANMLSSSAKRLDSLVKLKGTHS
jgi:uncharacterized protein (DUF58 family)